MTHICVILKTIMFNDIVELRKHSDSWVTRCVKQTLSSSGVAEGGG